MKSDHKRKETEKRDHVVQVSCVYTKDIETCARDMCTRVSTKKTWRPPKRPSDCALLCHKRNLMCHNRDLCTAIFFQTKETWRPRQETKRVILETKRRRQELCAMQSLYRQKKPHCTRVSERWGAGVETQKNVRGEIGGWGRVPFNEPYAPSLNTIYDGA